MSHVFPRVNNAKYPVAARGEGVYIIDTEGKKYLDGSCGAAVSCLGHSNDAVRNAIKNQIDKIAIVFALSYQDTLDLEQLLRKKDYKLLMFIMVNHNYLEIFQSY